MIAFIFIYPAQQYIYAAKYKSLSLKKSGHILHNNKKTQREQDLVFSVELNLK